MIRLRYLEKERIVKVRNGMGIKALVRLRCGNIEEENKYWRKRTECVFYERRKDNMSHFTDNAKLQEIGLKT